VEFEFGGETFRITHADRESLLDDVAVRIRAGEGFAIATLNLDHMVKLGASAAFRAAYRAHDFVVADGNPVVWLSRLAGRPVRLVAGSDLVIPLAHVAAESQVPVALIGSTGDALDGAVVALQRIVPGLGVTLLHAPEMNFDPDGPDGLAVLSEIADSGAGLAFVALGAVRQERLAARGRHSLPHVGFVSVGAGIDFLGGRQRRAPWLMRKLALEWLWRALTDPMRLGPRYLQSAYILPGQVAAALRLARARDR
jgi:exopolysaccharide biosynthesis WecB/TagA/CpsF family protein